MLFITSFFERNTILFESKTGNFSAGNIDIFWSIMNITVIFSVYLTFFSFIYIKMNRFHPILNFVSLLTGGVLFAFSYPMFTTVSYNDTINMWVASYDTWILALVVPLFLFFTIAVILPLATKIRELTDQALKAQMIFQVVGLGMVLIWTILAGFTDVQIIAFIRPFIFPVGWFIWSLTVLVDPFNIMVSNAEVSQIYIATQEGIPIYFKDFEGSQKISANLIATMISGITLALEGLVHQKDRLSVLNYENQVVGIVSVDFLTAYIFGERFDRTFETVLTFSLESLLDDPELMSVITPGSIEFTENNQQKVNDIVNKALRSVLIIRE
ncbi:MAG: hypothetical protein GF308_22145 [Candidatus Heimdallarchaeota archaeon]|nr:hypothetical protein [Candidatus Heimdallarchaeota archaeon]